MSNFLNFITEDIEAKKALLSSSPINTKPNIKKYNIKVDEISSKYAEYKQAVKKYIETKSKNFNVSVDKKDPEEIKSQIKKLEYVAFILNPINTYFEKMGFDNLEYKMSNYNSFNFDVVVQIINEFIDKFELAGIFLTSNDFNYTCYVNQYMKTFLEVRKSGSNDYDLVSTVFEKIYWFNPEVIEHVELNFRKLIKENKTKFIQYIQRVQKEIMISNSVSSYDECLDKLKYYYTQLEKLEEENVGDIIESAKANKLDMTHYFEESKICIGNYSSLLIDSSVKNNSDLMEKVYDNLRKLKFNIKEFENYSIFIPMIEAFKKEYEKELIGVNPKEIEKHLKQLESQINDYENKLFKINKKIFADKFWFSETESAVSTRQLKIDAVMQAKKLYNLYKDFDIKKFKGKVLMNLNKFFTVSEFLKLYYSFNRFLKIDIEKNLGIESYDEIIEYSNKFNLFATNPHNVIVNGITLFEQSDIIKTIVNRYRLDNININEEDLNVDDFSDILNKIKFLLRINVIKNSSTTVEKIWFMAMVEKFKTKEK